jgi:hypothetical protein
MSLPLVQSNRRGTLDFAHFVAVARMLTLDKHEVQKQETLAHYRAGGMSPELYQKRLHERPFLFSDIVAPMPLGFRRIQEGEVITIGGRLWDIRMGNGHAPEHATFWCRDEPLVLAGDQILSSISPNIGVYATEPEADPVAEWLEACERLSHFADEEAGPAGPNCRSPASDPDFPTDREPRKRA